MAMYAIISQNLVDKNTKFNDIFQTDKHDLDENENETSNLYNTPPKNIPHNIPITHTTQKKYSATKRLETKNQAKNV